MEAVAEEVDPVVMPSRHRLSVDDLLRMDAAGALAPEARVELIEGELFDMAPIGDWHAATVGRLTRLFVQTVGDQAIVWVQNPLRLSDRTLTQPDLALLKPRDDFYASAAPTAADALLVVEVSDSTAGYDRRVKAPLYARHGVPELWIVDFPARRLRVLRDPQDGQYCSVSALEAPGLVELPAMAGTAVDLSGLF